MTAPLSYTPYHGSSKPFSIGLTALDPARWIEPDADLAYFLDEKDHLCRTRLDAVFQAEAGTDDAQRECLEMLVAHLGEQHGDLYQRSGDTMQFAGRTVDLATTDRPSLLVAGALIQDDLVILRRRETGWHVVAGYVAFPSAWSLQEKIGRPMEEVHAPVPGFERGTRNATLINRIFDNLQPDQPAMRMNWSVYAAGDLYWPPERNAEADRAGPFVPATNVVRVERQTLRRLPQTGDIVFTIRIYADPIAAILSHPEGARLARSLADRLEGLEPDQLAYKGMIAKKAALIAYLRAAAADRTTI